MILGTGCLGAAALDGPAIYSALERLKLDTALLTASEGTEGVGLAGVPGVGVRCEWAHRRRGIAAASAVRSERLVLDLPDDMELEPACRALFELSRSVPGLGLAVITPAGGPLADVETLGLLFEDQAARGVGWWHVPSRTALAGQDDTSWFEGLGRHLVGLSLDDVSDGAAGLPPGIGQLDLPRLAELTGRSVEATLDTDPLPDPALLVSAVDTLLAAGFR
jgi:hypothetical protein